MPEVIQDWLGTHLGILLDLSPEKFGRNTKDGKLLAKLLYNYGVLPVHILDKIKESKNYYDCYNNLTILKPWLNYIGVTHDESTLQKMAGGEGSSAISIFYAVYLNLERKDRLHYLSAQKERRYTENSCTRRFKVDWVPEKGIRKDSDNSAAELSFPLYEKRDMIDWHRAKCKEVVEIIKKTKQKFEKIVNKKNKPLGPIVSKHTTSKPLDKRCLEALETNEKINEFERKHLRDCPDLNYSDLIELKNTVELQPCMSVPNMDEAVNIVSNIKRRKKNETYARNFQEKMQFMVLDSEWQKIIDKQNGDFENTVCANLLKQSQYEKQMINKLSIMRNQKKVLAENRRMIESLKMDCKEKDFDDVLINNMEIRGEDWGEEEFEKERLAELHRRIYGEKVRVRKELLKAETKRIIEAFIDIAIRISEVRELTGCQVPKSLMKDMKELFFKDLSIFDILDNLEKLHQSSSQLNIVGNTCGSQEEEVVAADTEKYEQMKNYEAKRQHCLNECDFNDYISLLGPWMIELLFPDSSETEVKHIVLGYIVHKLLEVKYPVPKISSPPAIKPMAPAAVVLGLNDENGVKMLIDLMEACQVLVVRVDDVINFVLTAYKEELSALPDIDGTFQKVTADALKDTQAVLKETDIKKKNQLLKKEELENPLELEEEFSFLDKQTQTPRVIPEEDPLLTPNAELGRLAFEALGAGDPVPDSVIVSAIVAYVVSKQDDYQGWVLLNYPNLYAQASQLECALTGFQILPIIGEMETLEDVEEFTYREPCVNPFARDDNANNRTSRLVPQPNLFIREEPEEPKTYFDVFINMKKSSDSRKLSDATLYCPAVEKFYSEQEVLNDFEYTNINFQVVKNLGKIVLGEITKSNSNTYELVPKSSVEIFGSVVLELNEKWTPAKKKNRKGNEKETAVGAKKLKTEESANLMVKFNKEMFEEFSEEIDKTAKKPADLPSSGMKPGDPEWEWADRPQPEALQLALASLWENMEAVYIEDFKDVFFCLRVHRTNVLSYSSFIRESMQNLMNAPNEKQKILNEFQNMFNDIDEDLRPDVDIKCELHIRVSELEQALMTIADERKMKFQKDRIKIAEDGWVPDEMANLVNLYLTAVQLEADRCIDSCQVIMDYYISMQQKIPEEKPLGKIIVSKLQIKEQKYSIISSTSSKNFSNSLLTPRNSDNRRSNRSTLEFGSRSNIDRISKTRSFGDRKRRSSEISFLSGAADVINNILVNLSMPDDCMTPFHNFFIDNVQLVIVEIKSSLDNCISETKKGDKVVNKNNKKLSDTSFLNLVAEWTTALENEMSRFLFRMKLILARGIFEMNEFLTTILNVLSALSEDITEIYLKEIQSISECCKVFRCAIEEEIPVQPQLELKEQEFIVNPNVLFFTNDEKEIKILEDDQHKKFRFTVEQLSLLAQKLQRVAPDGEIIKRSLVFILEDLRVRKSEDENNNCFPEIWTHIDANDLAVIINEIYQDLEIVHWKDFIIYGLELSNPTETEILSMRKMFRNFDPLVTELINREDYNSICFWFESRLGHYTEVDRHEKAKDLLYRLYQVDEYQTNYSALLLALCKDKNPIFGFTKALALALGKGINVYETPHVYFPAEEEAFEGDNYELFSESDTNTPKKPYCCPSSSSEFMGKCVPRRKIPKCDCPYVQKSSSSTDQEEEEEVSSLGDFGESGSLFYYDSKISDGDSITSIVPTNILSSLLKASFPYLSQLSILLDCKQTFQETIDSIIDNLEAFDGSIDVNKLLRHIFIKRLILSTNKYKFIQIQDVLLSLIQRKNSGVQVACTSFDKLNTKYC